MRSLSTPVARSVAGALLALAVAGCSTTAPPPGGTREAAPVVGEVTGQETLWQDADAGWVRLVAAESGAGGYDHPVKVDPQWLRQTLYDIKLRGTDKADENESAPPIRLFQVKELDVLVPAIAQGLAQAGPDQAVAFATAARRGGFTFFDPVRLTTARVFVSDGELNVLFGPVGEPLAEDSVRGEIRGAPVGTRAAVLNDDDRVWSRSWGSTMPREDWVARPVKTTQGALPELPASGEPMSASREEGRAASEPQAAAPPSRNGGGIRERLELLKELHEDGLITEDEYRAERQEILDEL